MPNECERLELLDLLSEMVTLHSKVADKLREAIALMHDGTNYVEILQAKIIKANARASRGEDPDTIN